MTIYTKTDWVDEVPESTPVKYKLTDDTDGVLAESAKIEIVTPVTSGTPVNATNLNKIETALKAAYDAVFAHKTRHAKGGADALALDMTQITNDRNGGTAYTTNTGLFGLGSSVAMPIPSNNANNIRITGNWVGSGATVSNLPDTTSTWFLWTLCQDASNQLQMAVSKTTQKMYFRKFVSASWGAWQDVSGYISSPVPVSAYVEKTTEVSTSSTSWSDISGLSASIAVSESRLVVATVSGSMRPGAIYSAASVRVMIDGTACPVPVTKSCNDGTTDVSWVPFSLTYRKVVAAGTRIIKAQLTNSGAGAGTVYVASCNLNVIAFPQ